MNQEPTQAAFAALTGQPFQIHLPAGEVVEVILRSVTPLREAAAAAAQGESFSLLFAGSRHRSLPQGTYPFTHPELGVLAIFIVPVAEVADALHYEAVFNRLPSPAASA